METFIWFVVCWMLWSGTQNFVTTFKKERDRIGVNFIAFAINLIICLWGIFTIIEEGSWVTN